PEGRRDLIVRIVVFFVRSRGDQVVRMTVRARWGVATVQVYGHALGQTVLLTHDDSPSAPRSNGGTWVEAVVAPDGRRCTGNDFNFRLLHGYPIEIQSTVRIFRSQNGRDDQRPCEWHNSRAGQPLIQRLGQARTGQSKCAASHRPWQKERR